MLIGCQVLEVKDVDDLCCCYDSSRFEMTEVVLPRIYEVLVNAKCYGRKDGSNPSRFSPSCTDKPQKIGGSCDLVVSEWRSSIKPSNPLAEGGRELYQIATSSNKSIKSGSDIFNDV
jgi:hypothetical protein